MSIQDFLKLGSSKTIKYNELYYELRSLTNFYDHLIVNNLEDYYFNHFSITDNNVVIEKKLGHVADLIGNFNIYFKEYGSNIIKNNAISEVMLEIGKDKIICDPTTTLIPLIALQYTEAIIKITLNPDYAEIGNYIDDILVIEYDMYYLTGRFRKKLCLMELDMFNDNKYVSMGGIMGCPGEYTIDRLKSDEYLISDGVMAKIEISDIPIRCIYGIISRRYGDGYFEMSMYSPYFDLIEICLKDIRHRFLPGQVINNSYCNIIGNKVTVDLQRDTEPHEYLEITIELIQL